MALGRRQDSGTIFAPAPRTAPVSFSDAARQEQQRIAQVALMLVAPPSPESLQFGRGRPMRIDRQKLRTVILGPLQCQRRQQIGGGGDARRHRRSDIEQLVQRRHDRGVVERVVFRAVRPRAAGG